MLKGTKSFQIVTFNLDFYYNTNKLPEFKKICTQSDLIIPDGFGIIFLLKRKYQINVNRITGNQILLLLLELATELELKTAFIGSSEKVQAKLKEKVGKLFSSIKIVSSISPNHYFEMDETTNQLVIDKLKESKPDIVFVALGSPRQEIWINQIKNFLDDRIYIGVGAAFDYFTGTKKRAPQFLQTIGLEWFWRVINEPSRLFKRYFINDIPFFLKKLFRL